MKAIIIDDEKNVINTITNLIILNFSDIEIVASATNIETGLKIIRTHQPDVVFLDIQLPDGTGFDLLRQLEKILFKIIFITGHEEYALDAIKISALDYILKPVDEDELKRAIEKAREIIKHEEEQLKLQALLENLHDKKSLKRIILRTSDFLYFVAIDDIIRAEADNNYTSFYLSNGKSILVSRTIKEFTELLKGAGFIRVHQSHLINISYIEKYVKADGGYIVLKDKTDIPVSSNNKHQILQKLNTLLYD
jgi:two-component system LytT family response regulator